jgi:hypothetical protein
MITNPYLPSPSAASAWAEGFVKGFAGPQYSAELPANIATDDASAYAEGVVAGQRGAIEGLVFSDPCVTAGEPDGRSHFIHEGELAAVGSEIVRGALLVGLTEIAVLLIELACTLPVHTLPPEQVLPNLGEPLIETLIAYGIESLELFCAAGLDSTNQNCEIVLSPMYKSLEQARQAATAMRRPVWVIATWRTDACNSFRIIESS